jgi:hypothetical protein
MSTVRILSGSYRNEAVKGEVFTLVKGFQTSKKGSYVTVKNDGQFPGRSAEIKILVATIDNIEFLNALCTMCNDGTDGIYSKRLSNNRSQIFVAGASEYQSVCRKHYLQ